MSTKHGRNKQPNKLTDIQAEFQGQASFRGECRQKIKSQKFRSKMKKRISIYQKGGRKTLSQRTNKTMTKLNESKKEKYKNQEKYRVE